MAKKHNLVCIVCPMGCRLEVTEPEGNGEWTVTGNKCKRGEAYGKKELINPTRVLPTTVKITNGFLNRLPVRTNGEIPKGKIFEAMDVINNTVVEGPVKMGDIIISNILDTGVDVVASRSM